MVECRCAFKLASTVFIVQWLLANHHELTLAKITGLATDAVRVLSFILLDFMPLYSSAITDYHWFLI